MGPDAEALTHPDQALAGPADERVAAARLAALCLPLLPFPAVLALPVHEFPLQAVQCTFEVRVR